MRQNDFYDECSLVARTAVLMAAMLLVVGCGGPADESTARLESADQQVRTNQLDEAVEAATSEENAHYFIQTVREYRHED